jgi:hypothetical protein
MGSASSRATGSNKGSSQLGEGGALRWSRTLPPSRGVTSIALGADATVVVVHGDQVLAVE